MSPSSELVIGRLAGEGADGEPKHLGYQLFRPESTQENGNFSVRLEEVGTICHRGLKGQFSFDEAWYVTYDPTKIEDFSELGYSSPEDPEFKALIEQGSSDIFLSNLQTGHQVRITRMGPGQRAMFPHFRSDGWIYFMVKNPNGERLIVASDAAIVLGASTKSSQF
jgi:hypothetical protein